MASDADVVLYKRVCNNCKTKAVFTDIHSLAESGWRVCDLTEKWYCRECTRKPAWKTEPAEPMNPGTAVLLLADSFKYHSDNGRDGFPQYDNIVVLELCLMALNEERCAEYRTLAKGVFKEEP